MSIWSLASLQRPGRTYALPWYTIVHIFTITTTTAERPTAFGTSTLLSKKSNVRTGNMSKLRTASVRLIQEELHSIPCMLNKGELVQLLEPDL